MRQRIFFASDHHFSHANILTFSKSDGTRLRNFNTIEEHDEFIVAQHNATVRPIDKVYFLGDVAMSHKALHILARMHGEKVLIKGNHDIHKLSHYTPYFKDIKAFHQFSGFAISHIPIHPDCLSRWGVNIHGHLHHNRIRFPDGTIDRRFHNVSMECLNNYTPISLDEIISYHATNS